MAGAGAPPIDPDAAMRSKRFVVLLALAAVIGVVASLAAWGFLELIYQIQQGVFHPPPGRARVRQRPRVVVDPGAGARRPGHRLRDRPACPERAGTCPPTASTPATTLPIELPGVILAALASIGLGTVLGPEAPLIALGGGLGLLGVEPDPEATRRPRSASFSAAAGTFAAVSFLFGSPLIAAVLLIEATGIGGPKLKLVLRTGAAGGRDRVPGLDRDGGVDRPQHQPNRDRSSAAATVRSAGRGRLRLDDPVRDRRRRDHPGGVPHRTRDRPPHQAAPLPRASRDRGSRSRAWRSPSTETTGKDANEVLFSGQDALWRARRRGGGVVARRARAPDRVQGAGLRDLAGGLPRRPHLPRDADRSGRRPDGRPTARVRPHTGRRGRDRRRAWLPSSGFPCRPSSSRVVLTSKSGIGERAADHPRCGRRPAHGRGALAAHGARGASPRRHCPTRQPLVGPRRATSDLISSRRRSSPSSFSITGSVWPMAASACARATRALVITPVTTA